MIQFIRNLTRRRSVEGALDGLSGSTLRGWACLPGETQPLLRVEVSCGGQMLANGDAQAFRPDLAAAGKRAGYCAFAISLDTAPSPGAIIEVAAILPNGERQPLPGSPITVPQQPTPDMPQTTDTDVLPLPLATPHLRGSLDQCGPIRIRGWAYRTDGAGGPVSLSLWEGTRELSQITATQWREDLATLRDGDGSCGFEVALPLELKDGEVHTLDLRNTDTGVSVLARPFRMRVRPLQTATTAQEQPTPLRRTGGTRAGMLSVVVNFYNMRREAERTLTSLSRTYQADCEDFEYEVLCIDNGSNPPLDAGWIGGFGPQFRLVRPSLPQTSPCAPINEAALQARGQYLAIMIDGAHVLTPGVFREVRKAWGENPEAVVALRHWFIGGDQRWLAVAGYSQEMEDRLFERIKWPNHGYELFRISAPIGESPESWLEDLSESNCLVLPTDLYDRIGGMDEAFTEAGGGFANLDLWRRAAETSAAPLVSLIGEASFHQFHGGTTTNVEDAEKDIRVRTYANKYRSLRGKDYVSVHRSLLHFQGTMQTEFATGIRQRTLMPVRLGITEQVRAGQLSVHFDEGAQAYLQAVYAECRLQESVRWMGLQTGVAPADLLNLQEIVHQLQPDAIITVGAEGGLTAFLDTVLNASSNDRARILCIEPASVPLTHPERITIIKGQPNVEGTLATAKHWTGSAEIVLVLYATHGAMTFSVASLQAYGALVSYRSYLICLGTLFGQPWLGYSQRNPLQTIRDFTGNYSPFVIDRRWNHQLITTCPSGYLRKTGKGVTATSYDIALDAPFVGQQALENDR